jgi:hypothetical protein
MIERVARAIGEKRAGNGKWEDYALGYQNDCRGEARAAIAAMREPTEGMVMAASDAKNSDWDEVWHPMIDAALKE